VLRTESKNKGVNMKLRIALVLLVVAIMAQMAMAQPHPEMYRIAYGNPDGSPLAVDINQDIEVSCWGTVDPDDPADTIASMFLPLKSANSIIDQRSGGYFPPDHVGRWDLHFFTNPVPNSVDSACTGILGISDLGIGHFNRVDAWWFPDSDFHLIATFTMHTANDTNLIGTISCPFGEGWDPANGGQQYVLGNGVHCGDLYTTYGCLYFTTCNAVPGDANGDGIFNAIDIVYGFNYLRGSGNPPQSWDCPGHGSVYVGADANGNCVFNGLDITYCVNYLKGYGPAPRRCPSC
jgi:hypothetical protein